MKSALPHRWDIFCRVIDNYGDIGVSWRLARQLANECGAEVRLWVDDLHSLRALCPEVDASMVAQPVQGVSVFRLGAAADYPPPGEVVIEAFGCGLPQAYVANMADSALKPRWIILEYLSAEPWVACGRRGITLQARHRWPRRGAILLTRGWRSGRAYSHGRNSCWR